MDIEEENEDDSNIKYNIKEKDNYKENNLKINDYYNNNEEKPIYKKRKMLQNKKKKMEKK